MEELSIAIVFTHASVRVQPRKQNQLCVCACVPARAHVHVTENLLTQLNKLIKLSLYGCCLLVCIGT